MTESDELLTVAEIAATLKMNQQSIRNWIDSGYLRRSASAAACGSSDPTSTRCWTRTTPGSDGRQRGCGTAKCRRPSHPMSSRSASPRHPRSHAIPRKPSRTNRPADQVTERRSGSRRRRSTTRSSAGSRDTTKPRVARTGGEGDRLADTAWPQFSCRPGQPETPGRETTGAPRVPVSAVAPGRTGCSVVPLAPSRASRGGRPGEAPCRCRPTPRRP